MFDYYSEFFNSIYLSFLILGFRLGWVASPSGQAHGLGDADQSVVVGDAEAKGFACVNLRADKRSNELPPPSVLHASNRAHLGNDCFC